MLVRQRRKTDAPPPIYKVPMMDARDQETVAGGRERLRVGVFGAIGGPRPSADGPGHPWMAWCPCMAWQ